jgi:hypothetical protein
MAKRKSTIYVDEDVLRAARVYAARLDIRDSDVVESALRRFLGLELLETVWARNTGLSAEEADAIAADEVRAFRAGAAKAANVANAAPR